MYDENYYRVELFYHMSVNSFWVYFYLFFYLFELKLKTYPWANGVCLYESDRYWGKKKAWIRTIFHLCFLFLLLRNATICSDTRFFFEYIHIYNAIRAQLVRKLWFFHPRCGPCWLIDEHMRALLLKDRPYQCDICEMRFTQSSSLNRHKKIHTGGFTSDAFPSASLLYIVIYRYWDKTKLRFNFY